MTPEQFAYWLQGFVELNPSLAHPSPEQWKAISEHLQTVFVKVTPPMQGNARTQVAPVDPKILQDLRERVSRLDFSVDAVRPSGLDDFSRGGRLPPGGLAYC